MEDNPLRSEKRGKLNKIRDHGINPFPYCFNRTHLVHQLIEKYSSLVEGEKKIEIQIAIAGRLITKRPMGKAAFFNIQDQSGALQVYLKPEELDQESLISFEHMDIGDIVGLNGYIFKTKKGELSLYCQKFSLLCKTLEPLPEKFHGLTDIELRYRYRHLDLIMNPDTKKIFETRTKIIKEIRNFLDNRGFLEVETPVLQPVYGGARAFPFRTHHRALDMTLYLKISPELYLKRLIVGGFEKVYEIGKNFRNEGIDRSHNPEFTMLEWYEAYTDYHYQMTQFEELVAHVTKAIKGTLKIKYQDRELDFTTPWTRLSVIEGIKKYTGYDVEDMSEKDLIALLTKENIEVEKGLNRGELIMELFENLVEHKLWQPTFIIDFPVEISPLTKNHREKKGLVERFEPIIASMELGNAYSELNDPEEQLKRLKEQESKRLVDEEAQPMDEDFMHAIDVGMPPTGGVGLGVERLVMLLTDQLSIRDILLFPTMKPR